MYRYLWPIVIYAALQHAKVIWIKKYHNYRRSSLSFRKTFNKDSALSFVAKQVDFGPRVPNLPSHVHCATNFADKLSSYGLNVEIQKAEVENYRGDTPSLHNIIAQYKPKHKT